MFQVGAFFCCNLSVIVTKIYSFLFLLSKNYCNFVAELQCRDYKMSQIIEHSGIIHQIHGKHIQVQIIQESACSACHAKGVCTAADMKDKYIDVESDDTNFKVGDAVMIYGQTSMGMLAVLLAFVIPFMLILVVLFILKHYGVSETLSGTIALASLIPYFLILSLFNSKLKSKLKFQIRKY